MSRRPSHGVSVGIAACASVVRVRSLIIVTDEQTDLPDPLISLFRQSWIWAWNRKDLAMPSDLASQYSCRRRTGHKLLVMNKLTLPSASGSPGVCMTDGDGRRKPAQEPDLDGSWLAGHSDGASAKRGDERTLINSGAQSSSTDSSCRVGVCFEPRQAGTDAQVRWH